MESACERVHGWYCQGRRQPGLTGLLAGWLAGWLAGLIDTISTTERCAMCRVVAPECYTAGRGLWTTTVRVVGHLAKAILRSVRSRDECFLRAREGEVQSLGPGLDLAARATQARAAKGS